MAYVNSTPTLTPNPVFSTFALGLTARQAGGKMMMMMMKMMIIFINSIRIGFIGSRVAGWDCRDGGLGFFRVLFENLRWDAPQPLLRTFRGTP